MGDYGNRLQLNANGGMFQTELSNEYSINGDYSAKILFTGSGYVRYRLYEVTDLINKSITFQGNVKTNKPLAWGMYCHVGSNYVPSVLVNIPAGSDGLFTVSMIVPENTDNILFSLDSRVVSGEECLCYTDNWEVFIQ